MDHHPRQLFTGLGEGGLAEAEADGLGERLGQVDVRGPEGARPRALEDGDTERLAEVPERNRDAAPASGLGVGTGRGFFVLGGPALERPAEDSLVDSGPRVGKAVGLPVDAEVPVLARDRDVGAMPGLDARKGLRSERDDLLRVGPARRDLEDLVEELLPAYRPLARVGDLGVAKGEADLGGRRLEQEAMLISEMARSRVNEREDPGQGGAARDGGGQGRTGQLLLPGDPVPPGVGVHVDDDAGRPVAQDPGGQALLEDDLGLAMLDGDVLRLVREEARGRIGPPRRASEGSPRQPR